MGNFVGMSIVEKLSLGFVIVRVITLKNSDALISHLRAAEYGVTCIDGHGTEGDVQIVFTIVQRREVKAVVALINEFNPNAFYTMEEVGFIEKGIRPQKHAVGFSRSLNFFKPFRKGK